MCRLGLALWAVLFLQAAPRAASAAEPPQMNGSLAGQLRAVDVAVADGRLRASCEPINQTVTSTSRGSDRREQLSLDLTSGMPTIEYELSTSREQLGLLVLRGEQVTIHRKSRSDRGVPSVLFEQPADGPLQLRVATDAGTIDCHGPSLWHLLILEPELCREHLVPLLRMLRPEWALSAQATAVEEQLLRDARSESTAAERESWQRHVAALASPRYGEREQAERELMAAGPRVLPYLTTQNRQSLDAEQWFRVQRIVRRITGASDADTPERAALALAADPRIWFALLQRDDPAVRLTAQQQLAVILGEAVEFDTDGSDEVRRKQSDELKRKFAARLAPAAPESKLDERAGVPGR